LHIPEPLVEPAWIRQTVARSCLRCGLTFGFGSVRRSNRKWALLCAFCFYAGNR